MEKETEDLLELMLLVLEEEPLHRLFILCEESLILIAFRLLRLAKRRSYGTVPVDARCQGVSAE